MEGIIEFFGYWIGRLVLASVGASVRFVWLSISGRPREFSSLWTSSKDEVVDSEDYKNRVVGFLSILFISVILVVFLG